MGMQNGGSGLEMLSTVASVVNGFNQQRAASNVSSDSARDAEALATVAEMDAKDQARRELKDTKDRADQLRKERRRQRSRSMAGLGASGVALSGSPLTVMEGRAVEDAADYQSLLAAGESAAADIQRSGARRAATYRAEARSTRKAAENSWLDYGLGLAGSLLQQGAGLFGSRGGRR